MEENTLRLIRNIAALSAVTLFVFSALAFNAALSGGGLYPLPVAIFAAAGAYLAASFARQAHLGRL